MLPETKFDLYGFKSTFMNCEEEEVPKVLEDFWANMDPKGFSFWRLEYEPCKGECEVLLKTENLIDMFT